MRARREVRLDVVADDRPRGAARRGNVPLDNTLEIIEPTVVDARPVARGMSARVGKRWQRSARVGEGAFSGFYRLLARRAGRGNVFR